MPRKGETCAGCLIPIPDRHFLNCSICKQTYDLLCANVSETRFRGTLTGKHRENWKCALCVGKQPKGDNSDTPLQPPDAVNLRRGTSTIASTAGRSPNALDDTITEFSLVTREGDGHAVNAKIFETMIREMRMVREELSATRLQLKDLNDTIGRLEGRVEACETRVDGLDARMTVLEHQLRDGGKLSADRSLIAAVEELKIQLNDRDQELLQTDLEISCVPEEKGEGLSHIVMTLANTLGVGLTAQEIVSVTRVGRSPASSVASEGASRPRLIAVRLARRAVRDQLLQAARVRRGATTECLGHPGSPRRFYVNERLTRANRQLFGRAREIASRLGWRYVWTRGGNVFARQHHGRDGPRYLLRGEADLSRVFGSDAVRSSVGDSKDE